MDSMKKALGSILALVTCLIGYAYCEAQEPQPAKQVSTWMEAPSCASPCASPICGNHSKCCTAAAPFLGCFPRSTCPDDYCPNPLPRQCWLPYPAFYQCVPAGQCRSDCANNRGKN